MNNRVRTLAVIATVICLSALACLHPAVQQRGRLVSQKLRGELLGITWAEVAVRMAPGSSLRARIRDFTALRPPHWVRSLEFPVEQSVPWRLYPIFEGATACMRKLNCHLSVLQAGQMPHLAHQHPEEELIIPLSGQVDILLGWDNEQTSRRIAPGQFAYYAAGQPHAMRSVGPLPATYLVLKWGEEPAAAANNVLASSISDSRQARPSHANAGGGLVTTLVFEGRTQHLGKLHCHAGTLQPGGGYDPRSDPYDMVMILLSGAVDTLGQRVEAPSVIFYSAEKPHGSKNAGSVPAEYIVFEFHDQAEQ